MVLWGRKLAGFYVFTGRSARPTVSDGSIFLLVKKDGVPEGRRISREEGKNEKQNDCVPGGPTEKRMPVKTQPEQNSKTAPLRSEGAQSESP